MAHTKVFCNCLLADVGGTHIRLGWQQVMGGEIERIRVWSCATFSSLFEAIKTYLLVESCPNPQYAALAIAAPITEDEIEMTNLAWRFSKRALQKALNLVQLEILNDFAALAMALPALKEEDKIQLGGKNNLYMTTYGLIGPGSGLGVAGLKYHIPSQTWQPIAGEGGHITLAAQTELEWSVLKQLKQHYQGRVSAERVLSGSGIMALYQALATCLQMPYQPCSSPAQIAEWALKQHDPLALQTLTLFANWLGDVAGDLALTLGAQAVWIGGGIVPKWLDWIPSSPLRQAFENKGRYTQHMMDLPIWIIKTPVSPALQGASQWLLASKGM